MRPLWLIADKMSFRKDEGNFKPVEMHTGGLQKIYPR